MNLQEMFNKVKQFKAKQNFPVQKEQNQNIWQQKYTAIKEGKLNPKDAAIDMINQMNPLQKRLMRNMLPKFEQFALKNGAQSENIKQFITEVKQLL